MDYVGKRVWRKSRDQTGTSFGSVEAYSFLTGKYRVLYDDGDSKEFELRELHSLIVGNEGTFNDNSVIRTGVSANLLSREIDLTSSKDSLNLMKQNDGHKGGELRGCSGSGGGAGGSKLHVIDLNESVNVDFLDGLDLNKLFEEKEEEEEGESSVVKRKRIDLNVLANEASEASMCVKKTRSFDLNADLMEEEVEVQSILKETADVRMTEAFVVNDNKEIVVISDDDDEGYEVSNMENKRENPFKNMASMVSKQNVASVSAPRKRWSRKKKEASSHDVELATQEKISEDVESGKMKSLESKGKKPMRTYRKIKDTGSRRSCRRTKLGEPSGQGHEYDDAGLYAIIDQMSSPEISADMSAGGGESVQPVVLPPKVELPPSSSNMNIPGVSPFQILSVYAFLRSFSAFLFLSPFELDDFVASLKCGDDSSSLLDSVHLSLLKTLRKQLESLSYDGYASASKCLRNRNWDLLDLITWPIYVVEYLLCQNPGFIRGLGIDNQKSIRSGYFELPSSAKVQILSLLCDDVTDTEAFRLEIKVRTDSTERAMDLVRNMKFKDSKNRKSLKNAASSSSANGDGEDPNAPTDYNGEECRLCQNVGKLICCDGCPAAFHARCVGVISSLLPEGDWYCPECVIEKDKPWLKLGKSTRGAELLGTDPYGRKYHCSCGYLLVLDSDSIDGPCWSYNKNELPTLIETLQSSPFVYGRIISAICKNWKIIYGVDLTKNRSCSSQSACPEQLELPGMLPTVSETFKKDEAVAETWSDKKSLAPAMFNELETENAENITVTLETDNLSAKMKQRANSEESEPFKKTCVLKESVFGCSEAHPDIPEDSQNPLKLVEIADQVLTSTMLDVEQDNNINSENYSSVLSCINSKSFKSQVDFRTCYVNSYEFAQIASSVLGKLEMNSTDESSIYTPRSCDGAVARQLRVIANRFENFSWANIQKSHVNYRKEKCGWCFHCNELEEKMDCLFIMSDSIPFIENFTTEALGIEVEKNREIHLFDLMCHMIYIEDKLQGLLLGPWLKPHHSKLWRKTVGGAVSIGSLKLPLLELESNLYHLALSADWRKNVDSAATRGFSYHMVVSSAQKSSKKAICMERAKFSERRKSSPSQAEPGLNLSWWKGGNGSYNLYKWKGLPDSLASNASRKGGCQKIPGIFYPESGENNKRTRCVAWRAAVETSRSVEQLALQIRELDAFIKWNDIENSNIISKKKSVKSFKKAKVCRKNSDVTPVQYLLNFGRRRSIPKVVVKHGSMLERMREGTSKEKNKYWLEESQVPLHLIKEYEVRKLARKASKSSHKILHNTATVKGRERGFAYLFSRHKTQFSQCEDCREDVLIREAVSCKYCKGLFHEKHVVKYGGSATAACVYSCHKCVEKKNERKGKQTLIPENNQITPLAAPRQHSVGRGKLVIKFLQVPKGKRGKKGRKATIQKKKRTPIISSYWSKGLRLSKRLNDERVMHFRSKMLLVIPGAVIPVDDSPKCSLCDEQNYASNLNYVACEICRVWFHGDALDLKPEKNQNLIGFRCHKCLDKRPPICPHPCSSSKALVSEDK